jgi:non-catalytic primase subunit PriX-like protein
MTIIPPHDEGRPQQQPQPQNKIISSAVPKHTGHTVTPVTHIDLEHSLVSGLNYILSHFSEPMFPRSISTATTNSAQILVKNKEEALARFKQARFIDCRISAFPSPSALPPSDIIAKFLGIRNKISPSLIMIDLDVSRFQLDNEKLRTALRKILRRVKHILGIKPTVVWSGSGFHIYIPIEAMVLEDIKQFAHINQVSTKFLRFAEWYLSSGTSDSAHNNTVSLNNCMLRIPGSINSKNNLQVTVIKKWDGCRPNIRLLVGSFCAYLHDQTRAESRQRKAVTKTITGSACINGIPWIERLLEYPIQDHRKFVIWRILAPYLINVKGQSPEQAFNIIEKWLDRCNQLNRISFYPRSKIWEGIKGAAKGYRPISCEKLKIENNDLYQKLNGG